MKATPFLLLSSLAIFAPLAACERNPQSDTSTTNSTTTGTGATNTNRSNTTSNTTSSTDAQRVTDPAPPRAPDNTGNNRVDRSGDTPTPENQSESPEDVRITADIRRAIMRDTAMSTNAQNIKIVTDKSGVVTLRGVVDSRAEKDSIDAKARAVTGVTRVDNQLEVQPR